MAKTLTRNKDTRIKNPANPADETTEDGFTGGRYLVCNVTSGDAVGSVMSVSGNASSGMPTVTETDVTSTSEPTACGVLISKETTTRGLVQVSGVVSGLYTGLTAGVAVYADNGGGVTESPSLVRHKIGFAISATDIILHLESPLYDFAVPRNLTVAGTATVTGDLAADDGTFGGTMTSDAVNTGNVSASVVTVSSGVVMGTNKITGLGPGTAGTDAVNKDQLDAVGTDSDAIHVDASGEISDITAKATPVGADFLLIEDSEDSNAKKSITIDDLPGGGGDTAKVSANDTTAGYLNGKLLAGTNVTLTEGSDGGDETLTIAATAGADTAAIHDNIASEISAISAKATPVSGDLLLIEDSADSNNKKRITVGDLPVGGDGSDTTAFHDDEGGEIEALTAKTALVGDDVFLIEDSEAADAKKKVTVTALKSLAPYELVETITLGSAATAITFSGLDGDADEMYYLTYDLEQVSSSLIKLFFNGSGSNIISDYFLADGATATYAAASFLYLGGSSSYDYFAGEIRIMPATGKPRPVTFVRTDYTATASRFAQSAGVWKTTGTNITSLEVNCSVASGLAAGSTASLYKVKK